ncbi:MFS transporter [Caballeronia sp. SEWSISQ10-4 2]|uniref:MFS transporter n=1 Tax=Caballeronia sp. SEWSISQ10-4 2 TaxID=2937438 RepID=UPI00264C8828|nr:MFS transporter [Caballeronia sp. SEWSISQ10-4 2]MDN7179239.1 MFS transporter [Caballeronia sp. SEWSISQ10-4 2]
MQKKLIDRNICEKLFGDDVSIQFMTSSRVRQSTYRKVAWRMIPFLLLCYMMATIDRFNIGFAKLQFLHDLKLDDGMYGIAAGIFYIGYIALEVPSNLWLVRTGVRRTLLRIMVSWGAVTCATMLAHSAIVFYILRFLLGVAEAGFFPGILFYITLWFPDRLRGRITSLFVTAVPLGGVIAGPASGLTMQHLDGVAGFHGWQWLFMIEGLPTVVLGVIAYFYLADNVASVRWLSAEEKGVIAAELALDQRDRETHGASFLASLKDPRVYMLAFVYFCFFSSLTTVLLWMPSILKDVVGQTIGSTGWISGGLSLLSTVGMVFVGYSSDKFRERRWHVSMCGFAASASFVLLPVAHGNLIFTVALLAVASVSVFSILGLFWTIPSAYLSHSAAAGGIATISSLGGLGGAFSTMVIGAISVRFGNLYAGIDFMAALTSIGMLTLLCGFPRQSHSVETAENY